MLRGEAHVTPARRPPRRSEPPGRLGRQLADAQPFTF
jgi:hypothetical protein